MQNSKSSYSLGLKMGMPIGIGYLAISFSFGIMASGAGLTIYEAVLISMFNLTSAGQLAALPIITGGRSFGELALSQLVINSRYSLMSVGLSQRFDKSIRLIDRFLLAFALTDEIFAVSISGNGSVSKRFLLGALTLPYLGWSLGTLLGALLGNVLPALIVTALSVSMYAMFIAIIVPEAKRSLPVLLIVLASVLLSCLFYYLPYLSAIPSGFVIIIIALVLSITFALIFPIPDEKEDENEHA